MTGDDARQIERALLDFMMTSPMPLGSALQQALPALVAAVREQASDDQSSRKLRVVHADGTELEVYVDFTISVQSAEMFLHGDEWVSRKDPDLLDDKE